MIPLDLNHVATYQSQSTSAILHTPDSAFLTETPVSPVPPPSDSPSGKRSTLNLSLLPPCHTDHFERLFTASRPAYCARSQEYNT